MDNVVDVNANGSAPRPVDARAQPVESRAGTDTPSTFAAEAHDEKAIRHGEWRAYVAVTALTAVVVVFMLRLWRATWTAPFYYSGDAVASLGHVKTTIQWGWYEYQSNLGAPYGQRYHDFPFSDNLSLVVIKAWTPFISDAALAFNLYYVLCFFLISWAALWFFRRVGVSRTFAVVLAVLYAVAPYHFMRNENHYFLSVYFTAPLALGLILDVIRGQPLWTGRRGATGVRRILLGRGAAHALLLMVVASTVAYYAVFAGILLAVAGLAALIRTGNWRRFFGAVVAGLVLVATLLLNLLPDLLYVREQGGSQGAVGRPVGDAEVYSLKLTGLLLPAPGHPLPLFARARDWYDRNYPIASEQPALGIICAVALVLLVSYSMVRIAQRPRPVLDPAAAERDRTMGFLGFLVLAAFLFATTGGLSSVMSFATDLIRGWNRMSIFMSALLLAATGLFLMGIAQRLGQRLAGRARPSWSRAIAPVMAAALLVVGVADQSIAAGRPDYAGAKASWDNEVTFVHQIEATVPPQSMIFQLPFIPFPEVPPVFAAASQDVLRLSLHSTTLRWSGGGLKGRPQTDWPLLMSQEAPGAMVTDLAKLGFVGIVVDRFATPDNGAALETGFRPLTGAPLFTSPDGRWSFLSLQRQDASVAASMTDQERLDFTTKVLNGQR